MTEETKAVDSAPVDGEKTSDQILKDIETVQRQLAEAEQAKPAPEPEPESKSDQVESKPADKPSEPEETSKPSGEVPAPTGSDKVDETEEWMKKKGFKSVDEMARSLRNLEKELHRRKKAEPQQAQVPPVPQAIPPTVRPQMPNYIPPELLRMYGVDQEDFEKVFKIAKDVASLELQSEIKPIVNELTELKRNIQKDAEFKRLENDPLFLNREVQREMHELAEQDPSILERADYPKILFDESLRRIGRKLVENSHSNGSTMGEAKGLPMRPPPAGKGAGTNPRGIPLKPPTAMTRDQFARLPSAEMAKILAKHGAIQSEE